MAPAGRAGPGRAGGEAGRLTAPLGEPRAPAARPEPPCGAASGPKTKLRVGIRAPRGAPGRLRTPSRRASRRGGKESAGKAGGSPRAAITARTSRRCPPGPPSRGRRSGEAGPDLPCFRRRGLRPLPPQPPGREATPKLRLGASRCSSASPRLGRAARSPQNRTAPAPPSRGSSVPRPGRRQPDWACPALTPPAQRIPPLLPRAAAFPPPCGPCPAEGRACAAPLPRRAVGEGAAAVRRWGRSRGWASAATTGREPRSSEREACGGGKRRCSPPSAALTGALQPFATPSAVA